MVIFPVVATNVVVPKLPVLALPDIFAVPVMFAPVEVIIILAVALPAMYIETLPLAVKIIFELPFIKLPAVATFIFATCVVLVTVNGAVPVEMFETKIRPVIEEVALILAPIIFPEVTVHVVVSLL